MAVSVPTTGPAAPRSLDAPRRRLLFGVNVLVQIGLAVLVCVVVIWLGGRFPAQADLTGTGRNSLSSRSVQLLRGLDRNIRITGVFAEPDKRDVLGQRRRRALQDLLELYEQAGGARVSTYLLDPSLQKAETDKLLQRLLELPAYRDEARPHQEALAAFGPVNAQIQTLGSAEFARLDELMQAEPTLARQRNLAIIRNNFREIARDAQDIVRTLDELQKSEVPRFGQAVRDARQYLGDVELLLQNAAAWMGGEGLSLPGLSDELREFFQQASARYGPVLSAVRGLLDQTKDLKDVKVEELYNGLTRWRTSPPVLVENEREARVIPFWDLWPAPAAPEAPVGPDGEDRVFAGEAAISSAILQLTQKDKTAVVFVRVGGTPLLTPDFSQMNMMNLRQLPRAPYQELNYLLEKANFQTAEWNVAEEKSPPTIEGAARTVYIIFAPEPAPRDPRNPMPPPTLSDEDRQIILNAVAAAGRAVFMAGWRPPELPIPGAGPPYDFADYLKSTWGIEVVNQALCLSFMPHPEKPGEWVPAGRQPQLLTTDNVLRFTDHPIGAPLKTDRAALVLACPLRVAPAASRPAGLTIEAVAELRDTVDAWACGDLNQIEDQLKRRQGLRPGPADIAAPFPLAVAAANEAGQKVVVFGSELFASDAIAQATGLQQVGNALVLGTLYPANSDLLINALHWLTGEADRIAVGPRRAELPRLSNLSESTAAVLPWVLVGVWPAVALVVGLGVWFVRRR